MLFLDSLERVGFRAVEAVPWGRFFCYNGEIHTKSNNISL